MYAIFTYIYHILPTFNYLILQDSIAKQLLAQSRGNGMGQWHAIRGLIAGITEPPI